MTGIKDKGHGDLKQIIKSRGYSQEELAEELKISRSSLSRKLNGISRFTISEAMLLVEVLGITDPQRYFFNF